MSPISPLQHFKAAVGLTVTMAAVPMAWLANFELPLRIILTVVGIGSGISAWRYYRAARKSLK